MTRLRPCSRIASRCAGAIAVACAHLVVVGGCTSPDASANAPVVTDSAGVVVVTNPGAAADDTAGTPVRLSSEPVVDIGVASGAAEYQLDRVADVLRLEDGRIVVANGGSGEIRFFDAEGRYLRSAGRSGSGPGEFRRLSSVIADGDSLLAFDGQQARVSIFDLQGELRGTYTLEPTGDPILPLRMYRLAGRIGDRGWLMQVNAYPADITGATEIAWDSVPHLLYDPTGAPADTFGEFAGMEMYRMPERTGPLLFGRVSSADVHADHLYATDGGKYEYRVYAPSGALAKVVRLQRDPRPVSGADVDRYITLMSARAPNPQELARFETYIRSQPVPEHRPWLSDLEVDALGNVWVEEYRPRGDDEPRTWSIFAPDGAWSGSVQLPAGLRVAAIGEDYLLGIWRDEFDVEHVRMYALTR